MKKIKNCKFTRDEAREKFILKLWRCVDWWDKETRVTSKRELLEGLMHTFLASGLDGCGIDVPPMELVPIVPKEDEKYYEENGEKCFPSEDIGGSLHEIMFSIGRKHGYVK